MKKYSTILILENFILAILEIMATLDSIKKH